MYYYVLFIDMDKLTMSIFDGQSIPCAFYTN